MNLFKLKRAVSTQMTLNDFSQENKLFTRKQNKNILSRNSMYKVNTVTCWTRDTVKRYMYTIKYIVEELFPPETKNWNPPNITVCGVAAKSPNQGQNARVNITILKMFRLIKVNFSTLHLMFQPCKGSCVLFANVLQFPFWMKNLLTESCRYTKWF